MLILFITITIVCIAALSIAQLKRPSLHSSAFPKHFHKPFRGTLDRDHVDVVGNSIIKHEEAEPGYVVLNGVKRRIEDCKDL